MKKLTITLVIAAFAFAMTSASALACGGAKGDQASANGKSSCNMAKMAAKSTSSEMVKKDCPLANGTFSVAVYKVDGLTCGGCELNLTNAFEAAEGVVMVPTVSYTDGAAKVIYDPTLTNPEALTKVISDAGYKGEIAPAVSVSNNATATTRSSAGCSASKGATANASGSAACPHAIKGANATTIASAGCSTACSQLTSAERKAFCNKFCKSDKKTDKKSKDI